MKEKSFVYYSMMNSMLPFSNAVVTNYSSSCYEKHEKLSGKPGTNEAPNPQDDIYTGGQAGNCAGNNCCASDCPPCKTSPVITGGAYERKDTDFSLPGLGFPFEFTRFYYSSNRNIGSLGLAWTSKLDVELVIVGDNRAYFQTEQNTIEFTGTSQPQPQCTDSYAITDNSKTMIIKAESINSNCYYVLYDYDNERKRIFYKAPIQNEISAQGLLKAECDFNNNCWIYKYADIKDGMLAPDCIYNTDTGIGTVLSCDASNPHPYITLSYYPESAGTFFGLLSGISDYHGRTWQYNYNIEEVEYADEPEAFIGIQGTYPRLENVYAPDLPLTLWRYTYYSASLPYTIINTAMPYLLVSVIDRTEREVAYIDYYTAGSSGGDPNATQATFSRVKSVVTEEGLLEYSYSGPGSTPTQGYCGGITKKVNNNLYTIFVDINTGQIKRIINPDSSDEKYCYHSSYKKLMYFKDENDNYVRYEYDYTKSGFPLKAIVRNACPFNESTCAKQACSKTELVWSYDYYTDAYGMPIKLKKILAPAGFQSWQYVYYSNEPPNPDWTLKYMYRFEADPANDYKRKGDSTDCSENWLYCQEVAEYSYYPNGLLKESKDALDNTTLYEYALNGELSKITYPPNNNSSDSPQYQYSYQYNASGFFKKEIITDPLLHATTYFYDSFERIAQIELPEPGNDAGPFITSFAYDQVSSNLRCTDQTDVNGTKTRSCYDNYNNLIQVIQDYSTQPEHKNITTTYTYQDGLLASITDDNGYTTIYFYDSMRRLIGIDYPNTSALTNCPGINYNYDVCYYYNDNGLLQKKVDAKRQVTLYYYDVMGRLTDKDYGANGIDITYSYKLPNGKDVQMLMKVTRGSRIVSFEYDEFFRTSKITTPEGILHYDYQANDWLQSYQIEGGTPVNYSYYNDGSVQEIAKDSTKVRYEYLLTGQKNKIYYNSNLAIDYSYDSQGRLTNIMNTKPNGSDFLSSYDYIYDYDHSTPTAQPIWKGYRTSMTETVTGQPNTVRLEKYYYDSLYQLTKTDYTDLQKSYEWDYDAIGNREAQRIFDITTTPPNLISQDIYNYYTFSNDNNSQLLKHDGHSCYLWDNNGNLACKWQTPLASCNYPPHAACPGTRANDSDSVYSWDYEDRLTGLQWYENNNPNHIAAYAYDFNGNRYSKTVDGPTSSYLYHNEDIIKEQRPSDIYEYLHGPGIDEPAVQITDDLSNAYYYADGLGSIRQLTNPSGSILNQYRYGAWGELSPPFIKADSQNNFYAYTSRESAENNLYYYRARVYSSSLGIFISADPVKIIGFEMIKDNPLSKYNYAALNSINYIDPYGEFCIPCLIVAAGVALLSIACSQDPCETWLLACQEWCGSCLIAGSDRNQCHNICTACANDCDSNPNFICNRLSTFYTRITGERNCRPRNEEQRRQNPHNHMPPIESQPS